MSQQYLINITSPFRCSVKRVGENAERLFSSPAEALVQIRRWARGEPVEVTITNQQTGAWRRIVIDADGPLPATEDLGL